MKISLNWLKDYVELPDGITPDKILYDLTMSTVEVEGFENKKDSLDKMYIGVVKEVNPHPDADKLKLVKTDLGSDFGIKEIVCGGSNLRVGMATIVAVPGAKVHWHGEDKVTEIKLSKIRGVESYGMICASEEIGLAKVFQASEPAEIIDLEDDSATPGMKASEYLNFDDYIFDIDNKSLTNRPDLWGHYGIARELSAIYDTELKKLPELDLKAVKEISDIDIKIEEKERCTRFMLTEFKNVEVKKAPLWMRVRLSLIDQKPINNLVDVTNYVMFTLGKPTHAFDKSESGSSFVVRKAKNKEALTLLDESKIELTVEDLVISDEKEAHGLAGIMGSLNSGVNENTTSIYFESANFEKSAIRKTMQRHDIRSDAGIRFEKGLTTSATVDSQAMLVSLMEKILPDAKLIGYKDELVEETKRNEINISHEFIENRIGQKLETKKVSSILSKLGFLVKEKDGDYSITVPDYRSTGDVGIKEDIVEEVARIIGYDNLESNTIPVTLENAVLQKDIQKEKITRNFLVNNMNAQEVVSYPWMNEKYYSAVGIEPNAPRLQDPPAPKEAYLRTSILPNILNQAMLNARYLKSFTLFELGRVFSNVYESTTSNPEEKLPTQSKELCIVTVEKDMETSFFRLKDITLSLFNKLGIEVSMTLDSAPAYGEDKATLSVESAGKKLGVLSLINYVTLKKVGLEKMAVSALVVNFTDILATKEKELKYKPLPKFPEIEYELSIVLDTDKTYQELSSLVSKQDKLIKDVLFIDQYEGEQIGEGKKSLSFKMVLGDPNRTLTAKNAEKVAKRVLNIIENQMGGSLRA